jgi:hypothetical protein
MTGSFALGYVNGVPVFYPGQVVIVSPTIIVRVE